MSKQGNKKIMRVFRNLRDKTERNLLFALLTYKLKHPEKELPDIVFFGKQGTGKTALETLCAFLVPNLKISTTNCIPSEKCIILFDSFTHTFDKDKQIAFLYSTKEIENFKKYLLSR